MGFIGDFLDDRTDVVELIDCLVNLPQFPANFHVFSPREATLYIKEPQEEFPGYIYPDAVKG